MYVVLCMLQKYVKGQSTQSRKKVEIPDLNINLQGKNTNILIFSNRINTFKKLIHTGINYIIIKQNFEMFLGLPAKFLNDNEIHTVKIRHSLYLTNFNTHFSFQKNKMDKLSIFYKYI